MSQGLINIIFKITGDTGGFKKLAVDADGFKKLIGETVGEAEKLKKTFINFAAISTGIDSVSKTLNELQGVITNVTLEGVKNMMGQHKSNVAQDKGVSQQVKGWGWVYVSPRFFGCFSCMCA